MASSKKMNRIAAGLARRSHVCNARLASTISMTSRGARLIRSISLGQGLRPLLDHLSRASSADRPLKVPSLPARPLLDSHPPIRFDEPCRTKRDDDHCYQASGHYHGERHSRCRGSRSRILRGNAVKGQHGHARLVEPTDIARTRIVAKGEKGTLTSECWIEAALLIALFRTQRGQRFASIDVLSPFGPPEKCQPEIRSAFKQLAGDRRGIRCRQHQRLVFLPIG